MDDGEKVVPLKVLSASRSGLQEWRVGEDVVASVTPAGGIRLKGITLVAVLDGTGTVSLLAILPDGSKQLLALGAP
jgi:hypothetical protein